MRCEHCNQNEATTYIKQNINGKVTEMHLCRDCAEKLGVLEPMHSNMGLGSMFEGSFFGNFLGAGLAAMNALTGVDRCDYCGSTFNDIINTGNVGCAHCYDRFADKLEPSIRKIHPPYWQEYFLHGGKGAGEQRQGERTGSREAPK